MKKAVLLAVVFAFSACLFGQKKTWILSLEVSPGVGLQREAYFGKFGEYRAGALKGSFAPSIGLRHIKQGKQFFQPSMGLSFSTFRILEPLPYYPNQPLDFGSYPARHFSLLWDFGYRHEREINLKGWHPSVGFGLAVWYSFFTKLRGQYLGKKHLFFSGLPQLGYYVNLNFARTLKNGRRLDIGFVFQKFYRAYEQEDETEDGGFQLLKLRSCFSIGKIEKSR